MQMRLEWLECLKVARVRHVTLKSLQSTRIASINNIYHVITFNVRLVVEITSKQVFLLLISRYRFSQLSDVFVHVHRCVKDGRALSDNKIKSGLLISVTDTKIE